MLTFHTSVQHLPPPLHLLPPPLLSLQLLSDRGQVAPQSRQLALSPILLLPHLPQ